MYKHIDERALPLLKVLEQCEEYFLANYEMKSQFSYKRGFLNCMREGTVLQSHSDDQDIYAGKISEEVHYSALLFLTGPEDYEGGEVFFWDRTTNENFGDLVLFKGSTMHGVETILSGERINYVIFYRDYNPSGEVVMDHDKYEKARAIVHSELKTKNNLSA
jgi:predicted 2-oxoglutarate/Fe(II)-dependent dioxygenase YbiX